MTYYFVVCHRFSFCKHFIVNNLNLPSFCWFIVWQWIDTIYWSLCVMSNANYMAVVWSINDQLVGGLKSFWHVVTWLCYRDEYYAWGLNQIAKAVSFLNNDCKLVSILKWTILVSLILNYIDICVCDFCLIY